jgi:hypothetical protein
LNASHEYFLVTAGGCSKICAGGAAAALLPALLCLKKTFFIKKSI